MNWFGLSDEERKEWRANPVTQAFFAAIRDQIADTRDEVVSTMLNSGSDAADDARRMAGRVDGMEVTIKIMERDS